MNAGKYERARRIFDSAESLGPTEQDQFLEQECGQDAELRTRVESLLSARKNMGRFLEVPAMWHGGEIDGFRIEEVLAEGGMGVVLRARQVNPRRSVALKLIRAGRFSSEAQRRFQLEAEVLGRLDHPGVARIFQAGTANDRGATLPYLVMEYIEGQELLRFAHTRGLDTAARIELIREICAALHHAHLRGIVHRDLKPANLLVREDGRTKILDFGVARIIDPQDSGDTPTKAGQILGTLDYMSPEQVTGRLSELDLRSDIYSLGVVTFELLTGRLPYSTKGLELLQSARVICDTSPSSLSSSDRKFSPDLETIVGTCLQKDPDQRYNSAEEFSEDLRRYLHDEPIRARPASAVYKCKKFVRRNRAAVIWASIALGFLVFGLAFSVVNLSSARIERNRAEDAAAEATQLSDFLVNLLASPDPRHAGGEVRVRDLMSSASKRTRKELADRPKVANRVHQALGMSYRGLGMDAEAATELRASIESASAIAGSDRSPRLLEALLDLSNLLVETGSYASADSVLDRAETLVGGVPPTSRSVFRLRFQRAMVAGYTGHQELAEDLFRRGYEESRSALGDSEFVVQDFQSELAHLLWRSGRSEEALSLFEKSLKEQRQIYGSDDEPSVLKALNNLGMAYRQVGNYARANELLQRALEAKIRVLGPDHPSTTTGHHNLALVLRELGDFDSACRHHEIALAEAEKSFTDSDPRLAMTRAGYAGTLFRMGRFAEARDLYAESYAKIREVFGPEHPRVRTMTEELIHCCEELGDDAGARHWKLLAGR